MFASFKNCQRNGWRKRIYIEMPTINAYQLSKLSELAPAYLTLTPRMIPRLLVERRPGAFRYRIFVIVERQYFCVK